MYIKIYKDGIQLAKSLITSNITESQQDKITIIFYEILSKNPDKKKIIDIVNNLTDNQTKNIQPTVITEFFNNANLTIIFQSFLKNYKNLDSMLLIEIIDIIQKIKYLNNIHSLEFKDHIGNINQSLSQDFGQTDDQYYLKNLF